MFGVFSTVSNTKTELSFFPFVRDAFSMSEINARHKHLYNLIYYIIHAYIVRAKTERKRQLI